MKRQHHVARTATETDFERAQLRHVDDFLALNGIRQAPLETGLRRALVFAELGHNRDLAFLHDVEAASRPDAPRHQGNDAPAEARTTR
ncbi:hypothetical protein G6F24_018519 [Rhizopus arrhizus]|nr:hypothetical protein G6F24_018519 [Rhizopus arrhizus]